MNFIWDIILQAEKQGIKKAELLFKQAKEYSPYYEPSFYCINQSWLDSPIVEINILYRFSAIFQEILHIDFLAKPENRDLAKAVEAIYDVFVHELGEIDLKHGLTRREFFVRQLRAEFIYGIYGSNAATAMKLMDKQLQFKIANEALTQIQASSSLPVFCRAVRSAFSGSIIYQSNYRCKELLIFLDEKKVTEQKMIIQLIVDLFLPFGFSTRLFWEHHFGIMDVDAAMQVDSIALF